MIQKLNIINNRVTPEELKKEDIGLDDVFVFGSNESGIHGSGAARFAWKDLDAKWGVGFGQTGDCFAIPTKDWNVITLPLDVIQFYADRFIKSTYQHPQLRYYVTQIGCGLAGLTPEQIAPMFYEAIAVKNIYLPQSFWDILMPLYYKENRVDIDQSIFELKQNQD